MMMTKFIRLLLPLALFASSLSGCSFNKVNVQPWQRGYLAKPAMQFDNNKLEAAFRDHTYFSKEAASGGNGAGAGGCGCN